MLSVMPDNIKNEFELVNVLAEGLQKKFNTDIAVREFAGGYGITDLVFAKNFFSSNNSIERIPINNYYALKTYLTIPSDEYFLIEDVMKASGTSKNISVKIVNSLITNSYILKEGKSFYKPKIEFINPIKNLIAIEVKMRDWKQGILQARRYKSYTKECYLAILSKYEKNIDFDYLNRFDIGLILFNEDNGNIFVKRKPQKVMKFSFYEETIGAFAKELFLYQANSLKLQ